MTEVFVAPYVSSGKDFKNPVQSVARISLSGLKPHATYRYVTGFGKASGADKGAGGFWAINNASSADGFIIGYCGTGNKSIDTQALSGDEYATQSRYGEFVSDAKGEYTGWFACVGSGNPARFTPGNETRFILTINDGEGGTVPANLVGERPVRALSQDAETIENSSTFIVGDTKGTVPGETIVLLYNAVEGGDSVWGTWVENIGIPPAAGLDSPYADHVKEGFWGAYVPNDVDGGVKRIEYYSPDGKLLGKITSPDGNWKSLEGAAYATANGNTQSHGGVTNIIGIEAQLAK